MNYFANLCFLIHLLCCFYMVGAVAIIHYIHYPAFKMIDEKQWENFHFKHTRVMGFLVGPVMVLELATAFFLPIGPYLKIFNIFALALVWMITFMQAVPTHDKLRLNKKDSEISLLLKHNFARTIVWVVRAVILAVSFGLYLEHQL